MEPDNFILEITSGRTPEELLRIAYEIECIAVSIRAAAEPSLEPLLPLAWLVRREWLDGVD